jgi:hypothetical protein
MERRSAAEGKSGIGGEMVRTIEANTANPDEEEAQETAGEGVSSAEIMAEPELMQAFDAYASTLLEHALLGDAICARLWAKLWEKMFGKIEQACASERELPRLRLAEGWLTEPEWPGETIEAGTETAAGSREPEE